MKYFSTFSGVGGFELGIIQAHELHNRHEAGRTTEILQGDVSDTSGKHVQGTPTCVGYSEIDKYAVQTYQKNFPNHKNYGDITRIVASDLPDFDLLVGGFPCQAFSIAGKRLGFDDTRGTLFFDVARILKEKRPRLVILENVKGLLSHDAGRTFKVIVTTLAELGYAVEWQVLNAKNHGVPQNRERVFIVGHLGGFAGRQVFPLGEDDQKADYIQGHIANTITARYYGAEATGTYVEESELDAQIHQLNNPTHSNERVYGPDGISPTLNTMQGEMRQPFVQVKEATKKGYAEAGIGDSINYGIPNSKTRRGRVGGGLAQTLDTGMQQATLTPDMRIRRLTPVECERLMGYPDGWTEGVSDTQRYKQCGNGVVSNVVRDVVEKLLN